MNATPFTLPEHVGTNSAMATVGLSQDLFDSALLLMQKAGALNMDITGQLVRAGPAAWGTWGRRTVRPSQGRAHRGPTGGGWGGWHFGATGWLCEGLNGSLGETRGGLAWGVAALKPVMVLRGF